MEVPMQSKFTIDDRRKEYERLFCSTEGIKELKKVAIAGNFRDEYVISTLRSLSWKLFMGVVTDAEDSGGSRVKQIEEHRRTYEELLDKYKVDPHSNKELDTDINNPLSTSDKSPWLQFFQNAELEREILQDVERTYPEFEFFQLENIKQMMLRILFIYARQHPDITYKQGMHEILAPLIFVFHREQISDNDNGEKEREFEYMLSSRFIEHDAFALFSHIMKNLKDFFIIGSKPKDKDATNESEEESPVVKKCKYIQGVILREKDPELHAHLTKLNIEPHYYMLRWVRLLGGREFHLEDLLLLWDGLFAYNEDLSLIDYICVAMLLFVRNDLLGQDYNACMRRLFKFPPISDSHLFIERALLLKSSTTPMFTAPIASATATAPPNQPPSSVTNRRSVLYQETSNTPSKIYATNTTSHKDTSQPIFEKINKVIPLATTAVKQLLNTEIDVPISPSVSSPSYEEIENELIQLKSTHLHMSNRLERIVYSIQHDILPTTTGSTNDSLMVAVAELKHIKDILSGLLSESNFAPKRTSERDVFNSVPTKPPVKVSNTEEKEDEDKSTMDPLGVAHL